MAIINAFGALALDTTLTACKDKLDTVISKIQSVRDRLDSSITVDGPLTDAQLRASGLYVLDGRGPTTTGTFSTLGGGETIGPIDVTGYRSAVIAISGSTFSSLSIAVEVSHDNTNWYGVMLQSVATGITYGSGSLTAVGNPGNRILAVTGGATQLRIRSTALGSVTGSVGILVTPLTNVPVMQTIDTELSASIGLSDGMSNPTTGAVCADNALFNNSSWDRWRNNTAPATVDSSSARTSSGNGTAYTNYNGRGVTFHINVTAVSGTSPTMTVRVQESYDGTNYSDIDTTNLQTASITGVSRAKLSLGPGLPVVANSSANVLAPRMLRLAWTIGGTSPSFTFQTYAVAHV